jgi:6-phosphogluconolactonase
MSAHVYISNAEDGDIGVHRLAEDGTLAPVARTSVAKQVMPLAVSADRRFLYAASRSQPFRLHAFAIDRGTGSLAPIASVPAGESFAYISLDRTGQYLFGASYAAAIISVNAVAADGSVTAPARQVIQVGRNAHSIRVDGSNRFAFVASLGHDAMYQFAFDSASGTLASNTPAVALLPSRTGPRHFVTSRDNRFLFVLSELMATVTTFALDAKTGLLAPVGSVSALPPDSKLGPGAPRGPNPPPRSTETDIWAADIHLTPDGKLLYVSERTSSVLLALSVDPATGTLTYRHSTPTERQPRGFAIDPTGRFIVACGEQSETISVHAIDPESGALRLVGRYPGGKGANWVEIVPAV